MTITDRRDLTGTVVAITGASSGIGRAAARALVAEVGQKECHLVHDEAYLSRQCQREWQRHGPEAQIAQHLRLARQQRQMVRAGVRVLHGGAQ